MTSNAGQDVHERALASLAILNVNWHSRAESHLDSFIPFVLEAITAAGLAQASDALTADLVFKKFGFEIPTEVATRIVRRAIKKGYGSRVSGSDFKLSGKRHSEQADIEANHEQLVREQRHLEDGLAAFALDRFAEPWDQAKASRCLYAYVDAYSARMVSSRYAGDEFEQWEGARDDERLIVAAYIDEIWQSDPGRFQYLLNVARGSVLATSLFLGSAFESTRRFRKTCLYVDTSVLIAALGFEGDERSQAANQWIQLAIGQGAQVACFEMTLRETKGVLNAAAQSARKATGTLVRPDTVATHFRANQMSPGMIQAELSQVDAKLAKLGIDVLPFPEANARREYQVDERAVESALDGSRHPYLNQMALEHDARALAGVIIARRGRALDRFEDSRAVFVTNNSRILRALREVADLRREPWPAAMFVSDVAALLWIKNTEISPDLPREQLIATCLNLLRPSQKTWADYSAELEGLRKRNELSDPDIELIAQQYEMNSAALIAGFDKAGKVRVRSPQELLEIAKERIVAPIREEKAVEDLKRDTTEMELRTRLATLERANRTMEIEVQTERAQRRNRVFRKAHRRARVASVLALTSVAAALLVIAFWPGGVGGVIVSGVAIVIEVILIVFKVPRGIEEKYENRLAQRLLLREGLASRTVHSTTDDSAPAETKSEE